MDITKELRKEEVKLNGGFLLNQDDVTLYSEDVIRKICCAYRLRFLSSARYKGQVPEEAQEKIAALEHKLGKRLKDFKIMAPASMFKLENKDGDPLLFAPAGNGKYYLIHKWGSDLSKLRLLLFYPLKNFKAALITVFAISGVGSFILSSLYFSFPGNSLKAAYFQVSFPLFIWFFISLSGLLVYIGFTFSRGFSSDTWNSKFLQG